MPRRIVVIPHTSQKKILSGILVSLFFGLSILGTITPDLNSYSEDLEKEKIVSSTHISNNNSTFNEPGFQAGSIFTGSTLATGSSHTCAILDDGSVKCWGYNYFGQLGIGNTTDMYTPTDVDIGAGRTAISIAAGALTTCVILDDYSLKCWGWNQYGQLGIGNNIDQSLPQYVDLGIGRSAMAISLGGRHTCAILDDASLKCWGGNTKGQLGLGYQNATLGHNNPQIVNLGVDRKAVLLSTGIFNTCAVLDDTTLKCWGYGALGLGNSSSIIDTPQAVDIGVGNAVAVNSAGSGSQSHTCAILAAPSIGYSINTTGDRGPTSTYESTMMCWGAINGNGWPNNQGLYTQNYPVSRSESNVLSIIAIDKGSEHTCIILYNNSLSCFGGQNSGLMGNGLSSSNIFTLSDSLENPVNMGLNRNTLAVSTGSGHTCAIDDIAQLKCWGSNGNGQLGTGNTTEHWTPKLIDLGPGRHMALSERDRDDDGILNIFDTHMNSSGVLSTGSGHTCSVLDNYSLSCWGRDLYDQLGNGGANNNSNTPVYSSFPSEIKISSVSAGNWHTCALLDTGFVYCWGSNQEGALGNSSIGSYSTIPIPVDLPAGRTATSISLGHQHTCAVLDNGSAYCWGDNGFGQLGDGTGSDTSSPVHVNLPSGTEVISVSSGDYHSCAVMRSGTAYCWGHNFAGQFGVGNNLTYFYTPVEVDIPNGLTISSIDTRYGSTCGIFNDSSLYCWGTNWYGAIGNNGVVGQGQYSPSLVALPDNNSAKSVSVGQYGGCALLIDGSVYCWGLGTQGQLGNGNMSNSNIPVEVDIPIGRYATSIDNGLNHACAILDNLSIYCWGDNEHGQLGDGNNLDLSIPAEVILPIDRTAASYDNDIDGDGVINSKDPYPYNPARWRGCILGFWGINNCQEVEPGFYAELGATVQTACANGTYQPDYGQSFCYDASAGHHVNITAATNQMSCPQGSYTPLIAQTSCLLSQPGSVVPTWIADANAFMGYSVNLSSRSANYSGTIFSDQDSSDLFDIFIPAGKEIAISLSSPNNADFDLALYDWQGFQVALSELTTPIDSVSSNGTNASIDINGSKAYIQVNRWNGSGAYNLQIWLFDSNSGLLIGDPNTNIDAEMSTSSWFCGNGTYQPLVGQISCIDASAGHYVSSTGAADQEPCSMGSYQPNTGQISCLIATSGNYVNTTGATAQIPASPGYFVSQSGASNQTSCSSGTYQPLSGQTSCTTAAPGYYVPTSASTSQTPCSVGTYQPNYGRNSCIDSNPGYYVNQIASPNQTPCSNGTYQPNYAQTSCIDSSAGHYVPNSGSSYEYSCNYGEYQPNTGQSSCIDSSPGYYVDTMTSIQQYECEMGYYQPYHGQSFCYISDPGYYVDSTASSNQTACSLGSYNPDNGSTSSTACVLASAGHYVGDYGQFNQTVCDYGTYQPSTGSHICIQASPGYYVPYNASVLQFECSIGTFQPYNGTTFCYEASPGYYVDQPASEIQIACPAGTYNPSNRSYSFDDCLDATPGNYTNDVGMSYQISCSLGTYQPSSGQNNCLDADSGYFVNSYASISQTPCEKGTFQPNFSQDFCYYADVGHYVDIIGSFSQTPCLPGTYNPNSGSATADTCIDAQPGFYTNNSAMYYQTACQPGTYQSSYGQITCIESSPGYYVPEYGYYNQIPCEPGTFNSNSGSVQPSSCINSFPGHYVPLSGQSSMIPCEIGTYQPNEGELLCLEASPGYYVDREKSIVQEIVDLDYYTENFSSTIQLRCPLFHITLTLGSDSIGACLLDTDGDRIYDDVDNDDDNDGMFDQNDFCPLGVMGWTSGLVQDNDGDGCRDSDEDLDDDNDGYLDNIDDFDFNENEWEDTDNDGIGNNADTDDDNDGLTDVYELSILSNPLSIDTDNDGYTDLEDKFPLNQKEWYDKDNDGVGDNSDFIIGNARYQTLFDVVFDIAIILIFIMSLAAIYRTTISKSNIQETKWIESDNIPISSSKKMKKKAGPSTPPPKRKKKKSGPSTPSPRRKSKE